MIEFLIIACAFLGYFLIGMVIGLLMYYFNIIGKPEAFFMMLFWPLIVIIGPLFLLFAIFDRIVDKIESLKKNDRD